MLVHKLVVLLSVLAFSFNSFSQISFSNITPTQAVEDVLLGDGVVATNITYGGSPFLANSNQNSIRNFTYNGTQYPLSEGILLHTSGAPSVNNDPDLKALVLNNQSVTNGVVLEFDFVPTGDTLSFSYIFSSAEYQSFTCSNYNDVFGFFISGPGFSGPYTNGAENIAIVPNSNNIPVGINTVNAGTNADFSGNCYNSDPNWQQNSVFFTTSYNSIYNVTPVTTYNGSTVELTANAKVVCGETYHIKLAISNAGDTGFDSGVFLKAGSFSSNATVDIDVANLTTTTMDSVLVEGCDEGEICFTRPSSDTGDTLVTHFELSGDAIQGVDFNVLAPGDSIVFLPGVATICLPITPFDDGIHEGLEELIISSFSINACGDSIYSIGNLWIADKPQMPDPDPGVDLMVCNGDTGQLIGSLTSQDNDSKWTYDGPGVITFSPSDTDLNPVISITEPGTYTLFLTETNDTCSLSGTNSIMLIYDELTIEVSNDTIVCENGQVSLNAVADGYGTFTYHWGHTNNNGPSQIVNPEEATDYTVHAQSELGCLSETKTIVVDMHPPISLVTSPEQTICPVVDTADVFVNATGGIGAPYNYMWKDNFGNQISAENSFKVTPGMTTEYTVTVTDGCETSPAISSSIVNVVEFPEILINVVDSALCSPATFELYNETDPQNLLETFWFISDGQSFANNDNIEVDIKNPGYYDIQVNIVTMEGCVDSAGFKNILRVYPEPIADFTYYPQPVTNLNTEVHFQNGSKNTSFYEWTFEGGDIYNSFEYEPVVNYPEYQVGDYWVEMIATSEFGCKDTTEGVVRVFPDVTIYAPNSFTPDGDEYNPLWRVYIDGIDVYDVTIEIFNRYGEQIWESHDLEIGWDGTYGTNGFGVVKAGTYIWKIKAKNLVNDENHEWNGFVNVIY